MDSSQRELLDRAIPTALQPSINRVAGMIDRVVNYGTHLIAICNKAAADREVTSVIMLGLHVIESLDAISVLSRRCCADPAKANLRSLMEATLGLAYMAMGDVEKKSIQYLIGHAHHRIDWYRRLDPETMVGKQLIAQLHKDSTFNDIGLNVVSIDSRSPIANLEQMLARSEYAEVEQEWKRTKELCRGQIWWYTLFDGPRNIQGLAEKTSNHGWYELSYRLYSGEIHATNALESLHTNQDMVSSSFQPIRYAPNLPAIVQVAVPLALQAYRTLIRMLAPAELEAYAKWYSSEIRPDFGTLHQLEIVDTTRSVRQPPRRK